MLIILEMLGGILIGFIAGAAVTLAVIAAALLVKCDKKGDWMDE